MKSWMLGLSLIVMFEASAGAEPLLLSSENNTLSLSIYNQNMALVKDSRRANLMTGVHEVIFDGVAQRIQPETAIIFGDGVKVNEQNYSYNLISYDNILKQYIGKEVVAVRTDPEDGKDYYEKALLLAIDGARPVIQTRNGVDAAFPGRIMVQNIPSSMSNKPTLAAKLDINRSGDKSLNLVYLTDGLNWKTDYVAHVTDAQNLDLTGWVTINNESGIDYKNAKIQLIAGEVNVVRAPMHRTRGMMLMAKAAVFENGAASDDIEPETINSYEMYTLPTMTTLKNQQTKQIALIEKNNVRYQKEFKMSGFSFYGNTSDDKFEKRHPSVTYVIENTPQAHLGIPLPAGTMRFYQNDKGGNLQFIGSSNIANTAKEDTLRLYLGDAFNISAGGQMSKVSEQEISREKRSVAASCTDVKVLRKFEASVTVNNAENADNTVIIEQNFPQDFKVVKENIKGRQVNASTYEWKVEVVQNSKQTLEYVVEIPYKECRN